MIVDDATRKLASRALKLSKDGLKGKAIGERLKLSSRIGWTATNEANRLVEIGAALQRKKEIEGVRFSAPEILLLKTVANISREMLARGRRGSPLTKMVGWRAGKSRGWPVSVANKRLRTRDILDPRDADFFGLVWLSHNGYISLTNLGWMVVHVIEDAAPSRFRDDSSTGENGT